MTARHNPKTREALLTSQQAADELSISVRHLKNLRDKGEIRFINVGLGKQRIDARYAPQDIDDFKAKRAKCQSTNAPAKKPTRTGSRSVVVDFQARRV